MQAKDLHEWEDSPESFHHEADIGSWEDHLRSCAETLFATLLEVCKLSPEMPLKLEMLQLLTDLDLSNE